ncbi:arylesterase [Roseateles koreensis]|uniref:Arylesterase n=1 Tax=Roseateles koreensis TaxID=2987526 RepID=A0ABT5KME4_9BURK|nr:arylesterase [Roseateles koreensis]MDC8784021.1 arylesterase [Roseateles koreensis]
MTRRTWSRAALHCSLWAVTLLAPRLSGAAPPAQTDKTDKQAETKAGTKAAAKILVVGDSLSAEYGLARGTGWVALLAQRIQTQHLPYEVINASISGDTTSGGLARLPALLAAHKPAVVIIELGGNDALRGLPLASSRSNLAAMVHSTRTSGAKVLLAGMQMPPNYGAAYGRDFTAMFTAVAKDEHAALLPFLLRGVADRPDALEWFQADRIHPLAKAHPTILDNVWPVLKPLLR